MGRLTLPQAVLYLEAIQQFAQMEFGIGRIYMNEAFAGTKDGASPTDVPSFWLTTKDTTTQEWADLSAQRGLKHPMNKE